jgi:hypothetical protein
VMYERHSLIRRSVALERSANKKLIENRHKEDNWREISDEGLFEMLRTEVDEMERDVLAGSDPSLILREGGDCVNAIRFILDKHNCLYPRQPLGRAGYLD